VGSEWIWKHTNHFKKRESRGQVDTRKERLWDRGHKRQQHTSSTQTTRIWSHHDHIVRESRESRKERERKSINIREYGYVYYCITAIFIEDINTERVRGGRQ